jgi:hypothetical protein
MPKFKRNSRNNANNRCPACLELLPVADAKACPYCGAILDPELQEKKRQGEPEPPKKKLTEDEMLKQVRDHLSELESSRAEPNKFMIVVGAIVALAVFATMITNGFGLFIKRATNPLGIYLDSAKRLYNENSATYRETLVTYDENGNTIETVAEGYFAFTGKTFDGFVSDVTYTRKVNGTAELAAGGDTVNTEIGVPTSVDDSRVETATTRKVIVNRQQATRENDLYTSGNTGELYTYAPDIGGEPSRIAAIALPFMSPEYIASLGDYPLMTWDESVVRGKYNYDKLAENVQAGMAVRAERTGIVMQGKALTQWSEFTTKFIFRFIESRVIFDQIFRHFEKVTVDGTRQYTFELEIKGLLEQYGDNLKKAGSARAWRKMRDAFNNYGLSLDPSYFWEDGIDAFISEYYELADYYGNIYCVLKVDKNRNLESITAYSMDRFGNKHFEYTLEILSRGDISADNIDFDELNAFVETAKANDN